MSQAKTLTTEELDQVLSYIASNSFALRNRVMLLTGMWSGMRVGELVVPAKFISSQRPALI
jgi:integrase/recombinase XerD